MAESTRRPSEPDDNPDVTKRKTRIQVTDLKGNLLDEFMFIDWLRGGKCRIVGQWNITEESRETPEGGTSQIWVFDESSLIWTPPPFYTVNGETVFLNSNSRDAVEAYVQTIAFEIIGYIKLKSTGS